VVTAHRLRSIIAALREQEAGAKTAAVCRKHGISDATFYKWKTRYGGLEVSEAKRLRALEDNAALKGERALVGLREREFDALNQT
jgi:transposase-like protein